MADYNHEPVLPRSGTAAELATVIAASGLIVGELIWITDENRMYVATAVNAVKPTIGIRITVGAVEPTSPDEGDLWVDTT